MSTVTFNGQVITNSFTVEHRMKRYLPRWEPSLVTVPGANGAIFGGTRAEPIEITMRLLPLSTDPSDIQEDIRDLAGILAVSEPKALALGDEGGLYRLAVPKGEMPIEEFIDASAVEVKFVCPNPLLHGESKTKSLSTTASVVVAGTAPTRPSISGTVTPNSDGYWKVRENASGRYMQVKMTAGASHGLSIDCEKRVVKVDGVVVMLAPDSDWFEWTAGTYALSVDQGGGTVTVAWDEMWW